MIAIKKRIAEQEHKSRREAVELVGLLDNSNNRELKAVIETFEEAGVKVTRRSFRSQIVKQKSGNSKISNST